MCIDIYIWASMCLLGYKTLQSEVTDFTIASFSLRRVCMNRYDNSIIASISQNITEFPVNIATNTMTRDS